jgi:hypothetical protein
MQLKKILFFLILISPKYLWGQTAGTNHTPSALFLNLPDKTSKGQGVNLRVCEIQFEPRVSGLTFLICPLHQSIHGHKSVFLDLSNLTEDPHENLLLRVDLYGVLTGLLKKSDEEDIYVVLKSDPSYKDSYQIDYFISLENIEPEPISLDEWIRHSKEKRG